MWQWTIDIAGIQHEQNKLFIRVLHPIFIYFIFAEKRLPNLIFFLFTKFLK